MTALTQSPPAKGPEPAGRRRRMSGWTRVLLSVGSVFIGLVLLRLLTGERTITSSGTIEATLALGIPIGMAGLAGLWAERAGVINIGLEGMMIFGTWGAAFGAYSTGSPWMGLLMGILMGALGGLLHAIATVTFGVDHIVSGVAINILAPGVSRYLSTIFFTGKEGGGATQSPGLPSFPELSVPGLNGPLGDLEGKDWVVLSDLAGIVRGFTVGVSALTIIAVLLIPMTYWILWRTPFGLRLRSCGENPYAAESLGVKVYTMKYIAVVISGAFAGLGGVFLAMVASFQYREGQTGGRGFIGLAAMIFGNWRPGGVAIGTGLFGYTDAIQQRGADSAVHALLLVGAVVLFAFAGWKLSRRSGKVRPQIPATPAERRKKIRTVVLSLVFGALLLAWYLSTDALPKEIITYSPHITTLLVLSLASQRLRPPGSVGDVYRRGGH